MYVSHRNAASSQTRLLGLRSLMLNQEPFQLRAGGGIPVDDLTLRKKGIAIDIIVDNIIWKCHQSGIVIGPPPSRCKHSVRR